MKFNEDMIRRNDLPRDVFGLIHDLCYHHENRDVWNYVRRAQDILKAERDPGLQWYVYRWDRQGRKGQLCQVLVRGGRNSCRLRFVDGFEMITSRNALKKVVE